MQDLLPEFIRLLAAHLPWPSVLDARQTCRPWAAALDPLITHLRVPLTATAPDGEQLATLLPAALDKFTRVTSVTLLLTPSTTAHGLQEALHTVGSKASITTVALCEVGRTQNTPRGYASGLQLWRLASVTELRITSLSWSLAAIWQQVASMHDTSAAADAVAANTANSNGDSGSTGNGSSLINTTTSSSSRSCALRTLVIEFVPNSSVTKLFVRTNGSNGKPLLPAALQLTRVSTPLPGQYSSDGSVVCPLPAAHEAYLGALAAGLPHLQSLTVAGAYEGREGVFQRFTQLRELVCELGEAFRAPLVDLHLDESDAPALRIASSVSSLTRLEVLSHPTAGLMSALLSSTPRGQHAPFKLEWLSHNTRLRHLAAPLTPTGENLAGLDGQLRSLTGYCMPSEELLRQVLSVGSGLTALTLYQTEPHLMPRTSDPGRVGRYIPVPSQPPAPLLHLHSLCLMADRNVTYTLADPAAFWSHLPALRSLKLQKVGLGFRGSGVINDSRAVRVEGQDADAAQGGLTDRVVLWVRDLPCKQLQRLELSRYYLVLEPTAAAVAVAAAAAAEEAGGCCVQQGACGSNSNCSSGVQPTQQQGPEAGRAAEVTGFAELSLADRLQRQDISAERAFHNPSSSTGSSSCDLSGLQHLALVDCCCLLLPAAEQSAASSSSSSSAPHTVQVASLRPLLDHLTSPTRSHSSSSSSLRSLALHSVTLTLDDFAAIAALGDELQELHVQAQFGFKEFDLISGAASSWGAAEATAAAASNAVNGILAAAARAGKLQQLRRLSLLLSQPPPVPHPCSKAPALCVEPPQGQSGLLAALQHMKWSDRVCLTPSVLQGCSALRDLQELRLLLKSEKGLCFRGPGWCSCCPAAGPRAGPWNALLRLQHLQRGRVCTAYANRRNHLPDQPGARRVTDVMLGVCGKCGGAVRQAQYNTLVQDLTVRLPGFKCSLLQLPILGLGP